MKTDNTSCTWFLYVHPIAPCLYYKKEKNLVVTFSRKHFYIVVKLSGMSSTNGTVGHIVSASSGMSSNLHISSEETCSEKAPFISQTSEVLRSTAFRDFLKENNTSSWCNDSLPDFLDYPENNTIQSSNIQIMPCEDVGKPNDWQDWADQLITEDDGVTPNWNEILVDTAVADQIPKVSLELLFYSYFLKLTGNENLSNYEQEYLSS